MSVTRYPNTGTLCYNSSGTVNTIGDFTPGTLNTIYSFCDIQPNRQQRLITGPNGQRIEYSFTVYMPLLITVFANTQDSYFKTGGESYQVLDVEQLVNVKQTRITI